MKAGRKPIEINRLLFPLGREHEYNRLLQREHDLSGFDSDVGIDQSQKDWWINECKCSKPNPTNERNVYSQHTKCKCGQWIKDMDLYVDYAEYS